MKGLCRVLFPKGGRISQHVPPAGGRTRFCVILVANHAIIFTPSVHIEHHGVRDTNHYYRSICIQTWRDKPACRHSSRNRLLLWSGFFGAFSAKIPAWLGVEISRKREAPLIGMPFKTRARRRRLVGHTSRSAGSFV